MLENVSKQVIPRRVSCSCYLILSVTWWLSNSCDSISLDLGWSNCTHIDIWVFPKIMVPPKSSILIGFSIINYKPSILGYPYFWKHPYKSQLGLKWLKPPPPGLVTTTPQLDRLNAALRAPKLGHQAASRPGVWNDLKVCSQGFGTPEISPHFS